MPRKKNGLSNSSAGSCGLHREASVRGGLPLSVMHASPTIVIYAAASTKPHFFIQVSGRRRDGEHD
jgi:hypothetical protein